MTLNVTSTVTHVGSPPAGDNSEKFGIGPTEGLSPENAKKVKDANAQLKSIISRIETLEEEKKDLNEAVSDIYTEAKGNGYDVKALRTIVRLRKMDEKKRQEAETILDTYMIALGML